jgi:hypothetical protein
VWWVKKDRTTPPAARTADIAYASGRARASGSTPSGEEKSDFGVVNDPRTHLDEPTLDARSTSFVIDGSLSLHDPVLNEIT